MFVVLQIIKIMKQKILFKNLKGIKIPTIVKKGEWIDLVAAETIRFKAPQSGTLKTRTVNGQEEKYRNVSFDLQYIPLGIAMKLPKGFEAILASRSSTPKGMGIMCANSFGVIDNSYSSNEDEWKFAAIAIRDTTITEGERFCQFRIQLSQKATMWQKIKWFFSNGIELIEVSDLPNKEVRGGFGSTGK